MKKKVLLIDDDEVLSEIVSRLLRNREDMFDIVTANTGHKAVDLALEVNPNVIVLDIMLPGENGWDIAEKLKKDERTRHIPIIVASGAGSVFEDQPYIDRNLIAEYVRKPYEIDELAQALVKASS